MFKLIYSFAFSQLPNYHTAISASSALIALCFSIYVYYETRTLLKPTERPILSMPEVNVKKNEEGNKVKWNIRFVCQNIGKNPANNLRIRIAFCQKGNEQSLKQVKDITSANRVDPGIKVIFPSTISQNYKREDGKNVIERVEAYLYVLVTYDDAYTNKHFDDEYYLQYTSGKSTISHTTTQVKMLLKPYVQMLFSDL